MYIIKNACRNIMRSKSRNLLIGCIAFVIGLSACLALSIKEAAVSEKENGLQGIQITASIGVDRQSMMEKMQQGDGNMEEQRSNMKEQMKEMQPLTLDEMKTYAKAESVQNFYYTGQMSMNGSGIEAVSTSDTSSDDETENGGMMGGRNKMMSQGDFTLMGYSSHDAMTAFVEGTSEIRDGEVFTLDSTDECIISKELATLNGVETGDRITFVNPENEEESYTLKVTGIYTSSEAAENGFMNMAMMDPANQIYLSYDALANIVQASETKAAEDEDSTALRMMSNGTYVFENVEKYEAFEDEVRTLGLKDTYTVSSSDVQAYEQSLQPLENLSTYATYFLIVILGIGGVILIVLNIYRIRERKYEIGVLAAIGMNKKKIASQFMLEIFITTMMAVLLGTGIGALTSVPVTNALLQTQSGDTMDTKNGFGGPGGERGGMTQMPNVSDSSFQEVNSAANLYVVLELAGIAILLTIVSGGGAVMTILRFEPLRILSERE